MKDICKYFLSLDKMKPNLLPKQLSNKNLINIHQSLSLAYSTHAAKVMTKENKTIILINILGIVQPNSVLPSHYLDFAIEREHLNDRGFIDFINIFHQKLILLYYFAWKKNRVYLDRNDNTLINYSSMVDALSKIKIKDNNKKLQMTQYSLVNTSPNRSRLQLERLLSSFIEEKVSILENIGQWISFKRHQTQLNSKYKSFNCLGIDVVLGEKAWDIQTKIIIRIGPIQNQSLLKSNQMRIFRIKAHQIIKKFLPMPMSYQIHIMVDKSNINPIQLSTNDQPLGLKSWLSRSPSKTVCEDIIIGELNEPT